MKMKLANKIVAILLFLLLCLNSYGQENQYTLKGVIDNSFNGEHVMLFSFKEDTIHKTDTAYIINGDFEFRGKVNCNDIALLSVGNYPDTVVSQIVLLDQGAINVNMDSSRVSGTFLNELYQSYIDTNKKFEDELSQLIQPNEQANYVATGSPRHKKLIEIGKYTANFKKQNIHNIVGQYFFEEEAGKSFAERFAFPSTESCLDSAFYLIYNEADSTYHQKEWVFKYIESLERNARLIKKEKELEGKKFIDFTLTDSIGNFQNISDYVGKSRFTMLEFWASWCGPCIASFPSLKDVYEKYDRTDFEIIGISIDSAESAWIKALSKINVPWIQFRANSHELEAKIMEAYSFKGIPFSVLLDKEGNIIASGHSEHIVSIISEFLE